MMRKLKIRLVHAALCAAAFVCVTPVFAAAPIAEHVVIIGVDGMSPDGLEKADTPNMDELMKRGSYSLHARGVMPTSSSSNWASILMGAGPEQHGITSNDWQLDKFEIAPTVKGPGGMFPTIFSVIRQQRPDANTAALYEWGDFGRLFERDMVNRAANPKGAALTARRACEYIVEFKPTLLFVHLDLVDHAGHASGHGSPEYYASVTEADKFVGDIVAAIKDAKIEEQTVVMVVSDHGGKDKGHGGSTMAEIEVPWIIAGPGIKAHYEIPEPVDSYQTAPTVAHIFGLKPPKCWIATPVKDAFIKTKK
ncbi:MAG: alkaline phosphatase [Candidatus Hydrogenedentes bacterium]|nr:alkaline phosphatase [Candidatus Hydrogenedentota bacterium]